MQLLSLDRDQIESGLEMAKNRPSSLAADLERLDLGQPGSAASQVSGAPGPDSRLGLDIGPPISPEQQWQADLSSALTIYIVGVHKAQASSDIIYSHSKLPNTMIFALPSPKIDSWAYKDALVKLVSTIRPLVDHSTKIVLKAGTVEHLSLIAKSSDADESLNATFQGLSSPDDAVGTRKMIIPIALLLLCAFPQDEKGAAKEMTKSSISNVLLSLVALWPDANPPRAALKRVNALLLGRDR